MSDDHRLPPAPPPVIELATARQPDLEAFIVETVPSLLNSEDWELVSDDLDREIRVYRLDHPTSKFNHFRTEFVLRRADSAKFSLRDFYLQFYSMNGDQQRSVFSERRTLDGDAGPNDIKVTPVHAFCPEFGVVRQTLDFPLPLVSSREFVGFHYALYFCGSELSEADESAFVQILRPGPPQSDVDPKIPVEIPEGARCSRIELVGKSVSDADAEILCGHVPRRVVRGQMYVYVKLEEDEDKEDEEEEGYSVRVTQLYFFDPKGWMPAFPLNSTHSRVLGGLVAAFMDRFAEEFG